MFISSQKLALSAVATALLLPFSGDRAPAQTLAVAIARPASVSTVERITPEATVVSTAHYHATVNLSCNGSTNCQGDFPVVPGRRRLNVTRVSCNMTTATYSTFAAGALQLVANGTPVDMVQALPVDYTTSSGYHSLNRAVDVQIKARQNLRVLLFVVSGGQTFDGVCTAQGTLETLQ
jgi:hypothetical protein